MRPRIAYFGYHDVFEDFFTHYGIDQRSFATSWSDAGGNEILALIQREIGDVTCYMLSLAPEVSEARHEVLGITTCMLPSSLIHQQLWRLYYLHPSSWRWRTVYPAFATIASYAAPLSLPLIGALWRDRPDFLLVQDYATGRLDVLLLLAKALRAPVIAWHAGSQPESYRGRWVKRWTIPRVDRFMVSGASEAEMLRTRFGVQSNRVFIVPTPVDTSAFLPIPRKEACRRAGLDPSRRYLLFVGRLDKVKRVTSLIRAFAALAPTYRDADLIIVGEGPEGETLRRLAHESAPDRIRFLGWRSGPINLAPLYGAAECLVLPSKQEGFPTVLGEAMSCGTPVLASRVGGVSELILEGETGWTFASGDEAGLGRLIGHVLANRGSLSPMRVKARTIAQKRVSPEALTPIFRECFLGVRDCGG